MIITAFNMKCDYCKNEAKLVSGKEIYPSRKDLHSLKFWSCKPCDAYVGCHKSSKNNAPLGILANAELRKAKSDAHAKFDPMWKSGRKTRSSAYAWLANELGIKFSECHIGMFDLAMCKKVIGLVNYD